ncbi:bifunctional phosphoribosyl-AMP cyclohydrolase/phosphoribosyl-ATP diphosphatase HisIE [Sphingomicrobium clamense]|uniref:Histidine biosynthesis bifunctional protein HisIE n=1 Tax=Sphingomicrobium clamense TaxID=2851013 RepID=A0ABS6V363_9SPHN|nr:bifunctional phosphoribosyl-AMP cyclohydrolase/phosphoribosyl-ATP diphosphatase HisIE [Sphingomicrobium sp. B8]MBW0143986.1 bifunctional phosphoribosyl-AMP cyclohydrolase/phosphoribosyl-ATP diphosphatase HisIE [Sphingomicrobium sp. B8]
MNIDQLAWDKMDGLLPAIVQDAASGEVRMLGYMSRDALAATLDTGKVTFFSRSNQALWVKGETSGNTLDLVSVATDCDDDALLVVARPAGPTCHKGMRSCFGEDVITGTGFIGQLERIVSARASSDPDDSYTARLMERGIKRIAQKVGEEGVEAALAATAGDKHEVASEVADLVYHLTVLLKASDTDWQAVIDVLKERHEA